MASLGKIEEFDPKNTNIDHYLDRLEQYFVANEVEADSSTSHRRRAILISVIGGKVYDVLADLCSPASPSSKSYAELKAILKKQFAPKRLVISERYRFHTFVQAESTSVSEFAAQLQRLASTCNFGTHLPEALRDRFVCGLRSRAIQKRLLTEDVNFERALQIAQGQEATENDVAQLNPQLPSADEVHKVYDTGRPFNKEGNKRPPKVPGNQARPSSGNQQNSTCLSCGKLGHPRSNCKYRNSTCHKCKRVGHIAEACMSKSARVNAVDETTEYDHSADPFSMSLYSISAGQHGIEVPIELNNQSVLMELDTGAGISIISEETHAKYFKGVPLERSTTKLHAYTGDPIHVLGQFNVSARYKSQSATLPLTVVAGAGPSLLGRNWLTEIRLDWNEIFRIHVTETPVSSEVTQKLHVVIQNHSDLFKDELGTIKGLSAKLELKEGVSPKFFRARTVPYALQQAVEDEYNRLERDGIIRKVEFSEWATPMVHVPKSDGSTRSCGNYAITVNPHLNVPSYPIPLPEDVFHKLRGGQKYTKLDLKNAYQQLTIDEESQKFVTINTHRGLYRYTRLPFGIASSPAVFQRTMDVILQGLDQVACIQDDILLTGKDDAEHLSNLARVLTRLQEYGLRLKLSKCTFMQRTVTYMGYKLSADGISPTEEKVEAIKSAPTPENATQVRAFLGLLNYHGKFIPNLSTIVHPLNQLLQKDKEFQWTAACDQAFRLAKESLTSSKVLVHFNPDLPIVLECDASQYGIGAVISHQFPDGVERPIAYASRSLSPAEKNYSQIEKEGLAIVFGVTKFYMYLFGRKFTLHTDHKPLLKIFSPQGATPVLAASRLQRWAILLSSYRYDIKYKSSSDIANADALSRLPLEFKRDASVESPIFHVAAQQVTRHPVKAHQIARDTAHDKTLAKVLAFTQNGWNIQECHDPDIKPYFIRRHELSIEQGCLIWGLRVIIPPNLREPILKELHWSHPGVARMKSMARSHVWWPKLDADLERITRACRQCSKTRNAPPAAPLCPWTWPSGPWKRVHVDFATSEGKHYLILVDAYSKWPEVAGPMRSTDAAATISVLSNLFTRYGFPEQVVSDNGPPFQSKEYGDFLKLNGIQRVLVSPYHPAANGQAERFVQTFKKFLQASERDGTLQLRIQNFLLSYRSTQHATTGTTPAKLFLQRELRTRLSLVHPDISLHVTNNQTKMKTYYDRHTKFRTLSPGDRVLARDHLSKEKWRTGTIVTQHAPASYCIQLDDGRLWRRHIDDLLEGPLQNQTAAPHVPTPIRAPPVVQEPLTPVVSSDLRRTVGPQDTASRESLNSSQEAHRELQPVVEQAAMQTDASGPQPAPEVALTPPPSLPVLRRSSRVITTPKRLITEI